MELKLALQVNPLDHVATVFASGVTDGTIVTVQNNRGEQTPIKVIGDVPYGHKIAVKDIEKGERIFKYGECIGAASCDIAKGEYVHIHNLEALRGRGDLGKESV